MKKLIIVMAYLLPISVLADDNSFNGDGFPSGPGVFSGADGEFDLGKSFSKILGKKTQDDEQQPEKDVVEKSVVKKEQAYEDFKAVKQGDKAGSDDAKDYQEYLEFKKYQEWKKQQAASQ